MEYIRYWNRITRFKGFIDYLVEWYNKILEEKTGDDDMDYNQIIVKSIYI